MKITFASLIAALTGGATAPKTLDQARATFTEAKAALDRFGALFAAASINLDELLAKGDNALKDFIAELNNKVTTAEASANEAKNALTAETDKVTAAESQVSGLRSQVSAFTVLFASIGFKPAEVKGTGDEPATTEQVATAFQAQFKTHVAGAVTQKMQELGVPEAKMPKANPDGTGAETEADLLAQLAEAKTPAEKGRIGAALNKLRDAAWGKN